MASEEWVRVQHKDELREAALVELRACGFCGKTERFMLIRRAAAGTSLSAEGDFQAGGGSWSIAPGLCLNPRRPFDPSAAISSGRLWRRAERQAEGSERQEALVDTKRR